MRSGEGQARAVVVMMVGGHPLVVAVDPSVPCDVGLVDRLLWMILNARRAGSPVHLAAVDDELAELLDLVGVSDHLLAPGARSAPNRGRG
jgi:hypothetical protein